MSGYDIKETTGKLVEVLYYHMSQRGSMRDKICFDLIEKHLAQAFAEGELSATVELGRSMGLK